jgi:hypothetical protein
VKALAAEQERIGDIALAERARAGDANAFAALVEPRLDRTLRTARAILGTEADARDATQIGSMPGCNGPS